MDDRGNLKDIQRREGRSLKQLTRQQQRMVEQNLNLARSIANKFRNLTSIEYEELESIAFTGLCNAIAAYDESRGTKISTFATPHIRGEILHYLRDKANTIKTPRDQEKLHFGSLDAPIAENMTLLETIAHDEAIADVPKLNQDDIEEKLKAFPIRQREILRLRLQGFTPAEIAEKLNIRRNNVYVALSNAKHRRAEGIRRRYDPKDYIDLDLSVLTPIERDAFNLYLAGVKNQEIADRLGKTRSAISMTIARSRRFLEDPKYKKRVGRPERRAFPKYSVDIVETRPVVSNCTIAHRINSGWTIEEVAFSLGITIEETQSRLDLIVWRSDR
jgi:RNA polymerase sigma factor (sigma-70 family)